MTELNITELDITEEQDALGQKLYTKKQILLATFLGSCVAGGLLIRSNLKKLGKEKQASKALWDSFFLTVAIFGSGYFVPSFPMDSTIYMLIQALIMGKMTDTLLGHSLDQHEKEFGEFHATKRAVGVSMLVLIPILGIISGIMFYEAYATPTLSNKDVDYYNSSIDFLTASEEIAEGYQLDVERDDYDAALAYIDMNSISRYESCLPILDSMDALGNLSEDLLAQNMVLRQIVVLKIEKLRVFKQLLSFEIEKSIESDEENPYAKKLDSLSTLLDAI